ncbi:Aldose 1-epimerase family protein [Pseudomonas savastanoi pv. glycinea]|uniref:Aldose 1-epimerase family protein n=1 Tax=Pseudomonas savastanoi pv. glycinea TaxID=318 RepID=A0ABR5LFB7_PSESG|nr:Aldose 1-epimerase family protein [Pseudomonas savastanoi pv. glycinea]
MRVTQSVTNCMPMRSVGTIVKTAVIAEKALFYRDGTDDAECDVSDG